MKDSRNIDSEDRKNLCKCIEESEESYILITHGTYTMPDTARYLEVHLGKIEKTIILTGSMIPIF
jgi:L-asparaginase